MKLGFIVTRASSMTSTWTTVQLAVTALEMGHSVGFINRADLNIQSDGELRTRTFWFEPTPLTTDQMALLLQTRKAKRKNVSLWDFDHLFLRTRPLPPYLQTIAMMAKDTGIPITNDPVGLLRTSSKTWLATRSGISTPQTIITSSQAEAEMFFQRQSNGVILKPDSGAGGHNVTLIRQGDYAQLHESFRSHLMRGVGRVIVQENVGHDEDREKRLLWLDGEVIGGYQRKRAKGEFRHNLNCGGTPEALELSERDKELVAPLTPHLQQAEIRFAGIDLLGPHILEVNVLNPGGAFHADRLNQTTLAQTILEKLLSLNR